MKSKIIYLLGVILSCEAVKSDLSDEEYNRMPDLFVIDDYDKCMRHPDGVYCSLIVELDAEPNNELYNQIQEYSADRLHHYDHRVLNREVCVPITCKGYLNHTTAYSKEDLAPVLVECINKTIWKEHELYVKDVIVNYCTNHNKPKDSYVFDFVGAAVVVAILIMNLTGSYYHFYIKKNASDESVNKILMSFSISQNAEDLLKKGQDRPLKGLNGLRLLALLLVVFAHSIFCVASYGDRVRYFEKLQFKIYYQIFSHGLELVQVSFALSGFLLAYKISEFENTTKVSWRHVPKILFLRIVRLSPSYAVVMILFISWVKDLGSGALWNLYVGSAARDCYRFFWHHMFYINNYVVEDLHCSVPTWHAAADTQLFVTGLLVLCLTKQKRVLSLTILLVLSLVGPLADIWLKGLEPTAIATPEFIRRLSNNEFTLSHIRGHNNLTCFIGAMITGLFVFKWKKRGVKIENKLLTYLSNLAPLAVLGIFLSNDLLYADGFQPSLIVKLVYGAVFRITLSAVLSCILISIALEFDSMFCRSLSWSGWEIPSKLCYSVFLIHMNIVFALIGSRSTQQNVTVLNLFITFLGLAVLSFILAVPLYVLVEAPFSKFLSKLLQRTDTKEEIKSE